MCRYSLLVLLVALLLGGCSSHYAGMKIVDSLGQKDRAQVIEGLYAQLEKWHRVPYRLGGLSKRGIDCSGLVYLTYKNRFGIELPRSAGEQAKSGQVVNLNGLQAGDLVFFKTGILGKHVGIYVQGGEFLHASTTKGVMVSNLSDPYWSSHYWKTVRIRN
ncbi:MAG: C40 family peptidase [Proteobacteria bacterium]|nr:C40 family peptidase [Pseudomonadota bacterium]MBU1060741.1 C40 family peptidase [Pseudomonadota bacterium]